MWLESMSRNNCTVFRVPKAEEQLIGEVARALHVLQMWQKDFPESDPYKFMRSYMIREEAVTWLNEHVMKKLKIKVTQSRGDSEKSEKRKDKYAKLEKLALEKTYHEFTTQQLADVAGLGAQTVTKWAKTTGYFRSIGRGKWEARNPKEDRKHSEPVVLGH
jgi:hypothetical protein